MVPGRNGVDFVHVSRLAIQTNGHDGLGSRRYRSFDLACINVAGIRFDIDEDRPGAKQHNDLCGGNESEGSGDDLSPPA